MLLRRSVSEDAEPGIVRWFCVGTWWSERSLGKEELKTPESSCFSTPSRSDDARSNRTLREEEINVNSHYDL